MDKRIALVTWFTNGNQGGTLQAYALQKVINSFGYKSEFVNYCPWARSFKYRIQRFLKDLIIDIVKPKVTKTRRKIYRFVHEELNVSRAYYSYNELIKESDSKYDAAICGSDQIWANVGDKIEEIYYLTFIDRDKRIAYAPSTGYNRISSFNREKFIALVKQIKFLSVREKQGAQFIYNVTGCRAEVVLDPTFLLNKEQWKSEINSRKTNEERRSKYIFVYFLGANKSQAKFAYALSEKTGIPIISVDTKNSVFRGVEKRVANPLEFLDLINNAEYVLTDSFHGLALSINLEKQFAVFKRFKDEDPNNQNSRILNILEKTNLQDRLIAENISLDSFIANRIDFSNARELLDIERKKSLDYLQNALDLVLSKQSKENQNQN